MVEGPAGTWRVADGVTLVPTGEAREEEGWDFELMDVRIGIGFHWQREERQRFRGALRLLDEGEHLTVVNVAGVEDYLTSVISSEMNAGAGTEFLKAHAVISRSWLLAQREARGRRAGGGTGGWDGEGRLKADAAESCRRPRVSMAGPWIESRIGTLS